MSSFRNRIATRLRVWRAAPPRGAQGLVWHPEPRAEGSERAGHRMLGGVWHLAGHLVEGAPDPWAIRPPSVPFALQLHGMGWLDDVMAVGGREATARARGWTLAWVDRFGRGAGPGWAPATTGRRLVRMIVHAPALLRGMERPERFRDSLYRQAQVLAGTWGRAPAGLPRAEALLGLLMAGLALEGMERLGDVATDALARTADADVGADGGIPSRNPEALLEVAMLLGWAAASLDSAGRPVPPLLREAVARIVPTLRALRHSDGGLARFHGGGAGRAGRLDRVLGESGVRGRPSTGLAMGFVPVAHGRTTLVVDAEAPPEGAASGSAHASTLAFELCSATTPVVVNCGPGGPFGPEWHRAGRATASHSTLGLDGHSSSRIGAPVAAGPGLRIAPLAEGPETVQWQRTEGRRASTLILSHDGWRPTHGLTHLRRLVLSTDGRRLEGEDALRAVSGPDKERLEDAIAAHGPVRFTVAFHLHPDAEVETGLGGRAATIALPTGEIWVLRPGGGVPLEIRPSVFLDPGRLRPTPSRQVVLTDSVMSYAATVDWTLVRTQEPDAASRRT
ncbi:heparinase II/III family protein [Jannaschia sp. W003]|uniref:heparinase II/III family protein n=1 Tax=Jannaschia sp. W003 TaxID=2867012 RepID=UPI0021A3C367|nr:heparinase II/III family protein [Jannaschia sp. W003]UWQ21432.1 heparinase II/III family protein [Jannaschia sp. W003]